MMTNEKIRKFNIYYLSFVTFLVAFGRISIWDIGSLGKHPETFLPVCIITTLYLLIKEQKYPWPITLREKAFLVYAVFSSISVFWGLEYNKSMHALREFWAAAAFVILIACNVRNNNELKFFINVFIAGVLIRACFSIVEYFQGIGTISASFAHYNVYANFLIVPISLLLGTFLYDSKNVGKKLFILTIFVLVVFTLFITMSRATIVAMMLSVIVFSFLTNKKILVMAFISILMLVVIIYAFPNNEVSRRIRTVDWEDGSLQCRVRSIWPSAIEMYKDHNLVVGSGPGAYNILLGDPVYRKITQGRIHPHAHNVILHALVTQGLTGAVMYIFFIIQVAWLSWQNFRFSSDQYFKALGAGGIIWLIAHVVAGIVHFEFQHSRFNMSVGFLVIVITLSYYLWKSPGKMEEKNEGFNSNSLL